MPAKKSATQPSPRSTAPLAAPRSAPTSSPLRVSGTLLNAITGFPLAELVAQVYFQEPQAPTDKTSQAQTLLGSAVSSPAGLYQIAWIATDVVSQRICTLASCPESQFEIKVLQPGGGAPLLESKPMSASSNSTIVNLSIVIPLQKLTASNWTDVGNRLKNAGMTKLSDLVKQLAFVPPSQSLFADLSLALRQNAVAQLETAFLDPKGTLGKVAPVPSWQQLSAPSGLEEYMKSLGNSAKESGVQQAFLELSQKVKSFTDISSIDWVIDPTQFRKSPASAITANQGKYFGPFPHPEPIPIDLFTDLGYRDYLRTQWTSTVTLAEYVGGDTATVAQAEQQLRSRFHQDFRTQDRSWRVGNEILIPILTEILTAPTGSTFGFGVPTATIPVRGAATARQYLETLIGLTNISAQELTLRYRTDFTRPDTVMSSAVWENIHMLQGFFRDSFQSVVDPADANPDVFAQNMPHGQPIIFDKLHGRAPFFLEYDEWQLLQQPIPFENYFQIRQIFQINISADARTYLQNQANTSGPNQDFYKLCVGALALQDQLVTAYQFLDQNEYKAALDIFNQLQVPQLGDLISSPVVSQVDVVGGFTSRRTMPVHSLDDLNKILVLWQIGGDVLGANWVDFNKLSLVCSLVYLAVFTLPIVMAQCSLALGDYPTAVFELGRSAFFLVGKGTTSDTTAYRDLSDNENFEDGTWSDFPLYHAGNLPYTVDTEDQLLGYPLFTDDDSRDRLTKTTLYDLYSSYQNEFPGSNTSLIPGGIHPVEMLFFRLQMGSAMLDWADTLYRTDDDSNVSRARELYKGVYFLHGAVPPINPTWAVQFPGGGGFFNGNINPAQASQLARAELGFTQINAGLNFFGYRDDMVSILRYSTLKAAADGFASEAKSAEQDFLTFMGQLENATIENMRNAAMLQRANLQAKIADQQAGIAQDQIQQAQILITQVNQQIASVQQQIADHDSLSGQFGDYLSGTVGTVKGMLDFTNAASPTVGAATGVTTGDVTAFAAANAGEIGLAGFGAFAVVSYLSLKSAADAQMQRNSQLSNLESQSLPAAQMQLDIANRSVTIANLNKQVAEIDAQLATQLLAFAQERYLSIEFWSYMATLSKRIMRQFLDLATRTGWLAERALSYEQNADIRIILMDYFPAQQQGAGGPDRLQLDLAVLEAQHLDGLREMIPVKYTLSLARDFPLQFAQLITSGQCTFQTTEIPLQLAYPGTYAYRIIAVTPTLTRVAATSPVRGLLSNSGISQISASDGSKKMSVRPADALPISEFNLGTTDMQIWGLPGGTLMQFEGNGVETVWKLEFPAPANPSGLKGVADVLIAMDLRAQFGLSTYQTQLQQMPHTITKFILVSALKQKLSGLADLQGNPAKATVAFDLTDIGLPSNEQNRKVNNIAFLVISGKNAANIKGSVISATPSKTIAVTFANGVAFSNAPPITDTQSTVKLSPLNVLATATLDQTFSLLIDKGANPGVDFTTVRDVLLGIDYTATV